jgi:RHS repeat-associated protein
MTTFTYQGLGTGPLGTSSCPGSGTLFDEQTSVTDPLHQVTAYCYDTHGNLVSITDPMNRTSNYAYNTLGQLTSETSPAPFSEPTTYGYDPTTDDLKSVTDPLLNKTQYTSDTLGRVTQVSTPMGNVASYAYDAMDHVTAATDGNGNSTSYVYDLLGLLLTMTDAANNTTTIKRPWTLNKETTCDMAGNCAVTDLDGAGKKTDFIDKRGIETVLSYDNLQRVTKANFNSTGKSGYDSRTINFTIYDSLDRVLRLKDSGITNTMNYTYDGVDDVTSDQVVATQTGTVSYGFDADSRKTSTTVSGSGSPQTYNYSYDPDSELTGITGGPAAVTIGYDSNGRRTSLTVGSVTTSYVPYDHDSRPTNLSYTAGGNSLGQLTYTYDNDSRVTAEGGNLASINLPSAANPNTFYNTNQLESWNSLTPISPPPDKANNLQGDPIAPSASFSWDSRNQLSAISGGPASSFTADYDTTMRRYDQTTAFGGTTTYLHDHNSVEQSNTGSSNPLNNYLTMPGTGEVLAFSTNGSTYIPIQDRLGSTIGLVNSANTMPTQYTYEPFGNVTTIGAASSFPYLFGQMELDSSGLYHTQSRYYSPTFGRFLSADSGLSPNPFTYAGDNPVNAIDPTGAAEGPPPVCGGWCAVAEFVVTDILIQSIEQGNILKGIEDFIQSFFDPFNIFGNWFGGQSAPVIPPGYYRHPHYVPAQFIGVPQEIAPNMEDSAVLEAQTVKAPIQSPTIAGGVAVAGEAVGEVVLGSSFWEVAAVGAAAVGIYKVGEHILAQHAEGACGQNGANNGYRCVLVAEVPGPSGTTCAYRCKGYGALATFPKPAGMASCPKGFNRFFPGP